MFVMYISFKESVLALTTIQCYKTYVNASVVYVYPICVSKCENIELIHRKFVMYLLKRSVGIDENYRLLTEIACSIEKAINCHRTFCGCFKPVKFLLFYKNLLEVKNSVCISLSKIHNYFKKHSN